MSYRRTRRSKPLAAQVAELAVAVPHIVAHRLARMAAAGTSLSARDRKELHLMGTEKVAALNESLNAMAWEAYRANQQIALSYLNALWFPWTATSRKSAQRQVNNAALDIAGKALAPLHRRAVANAKRLSRTKRR